MSIKSIILYFTIFYLLILFTVGIYYEDMTDVFISVMSRGIFTSKPVPIFNNYTAHFGVNHLYSNLNLFYSLGWYGILNLIFQYLSLLNTVILCYNVLQHINIQYKWMIFLFISVYLINDIIFLQYTKTSIFLICSSLLNLIYYHLQRNKVSFNLILANASFFILGLLLRPQIFYLTVLFLFPFLIYNRNRILKSLSRRELKTYGCLFILSTFILILSNKSFTKSDQKYNVFSKYKSSVWDGKLEDNTLMLKSQKDSTIYSSFQNYFFPDTQFISSMYLDKLGIIKAHSTIDFIIVSSNHIVFKIKNAVKSLHTTLINENYKIFLLASIILLLLYLSAYKVSVFLKVIFQIIWTFTSLFLITLILKMENRILFPVLFFSILSSFFYLNNFKKEKNKIYQGLLILNIISVLLFIYGNSFIYIRKYYGQKEINQFLFHIKNENRNGVYLLDAFTINLLANNVLQSSLYKNEINWYSFDAGYLIFYDEYYSKRKKIFGYNNLKDCILNIKKNNPNIVFIYSPERLILLKNYVKDVYHVDLEFYKTNTKSYINYPIFGRPIIINSYTLILNNENRE